MLKKQEKKSKKIKIKGERRNDIINQEKGKLTK